MKTKVQTFIHLIDIKGWEKSLEWTLSERPPTTYRIRKKIKLSLNPPDISNIPINDDIEFQWKSEKFEELNDKFYNYHVYYEEGW